MSDEKRQFTRVPKAVPIRLKFAGLTDFLDAFTEDISLGGVFVATDRAVPLGTRVELTIELALNKGFVVGAQVVWRRDATAKKRAGVGLRFFDIQAKHRQWLDAAVAEHLVKKGIPRDAAGSFRLPEAADGEDLVEAHIDLTNPAIAENDEPILGIDLGTSNSCACLLFSGDYILIEFGLEGQPQEQTLPSVVAYDDHDRVLVGHAALGDLEANAKRTVYGSKRFIGRNYVHPDVQRMLPRYPYKVVPTDQGRVAVLVNDRPIDLIEVSAKILEHIKIRAQKRIRQPISRAIITVPAAYNQNQRDAVTQAGRLAGLTVERIINEPTAAAIAYGITNQSPRNILVYDLGGGTFDVSVMSIGAQKLEVLATAGDTFLGGEDFDEAIVELACQRFERDSGKRLSRNHAAMALIKAAAERAKKRLSLHEKSMVTVRNALLVDGTNARLELEVSCAEVNGLVAPMVTRTLEICDFTLAEAGLTTEGIGDVILVGGQTLMPYVRQRVTDHFGREPRRDLRPDEVVALGAGMLTQMHSKDEAKGLRDTLALSIGIEAGDGRYLKLLRRNTPVPCSGSYDLEVPRQDLGRRRVNVYQGESDDLLQNEHLGAIHLDVLSAGEQTTVRRRIQLFLSPDCLLSVVVRDPETAREINVLLDAGRPA